MNMYIKLCISLVLMHCLNCSAIAQQWIQMHTMGGPLTNSMVVKPDGSLLISTYKFVLQWNTETTQWDTLSQYDNITMNKMATNPRGELFAGGAKGVWYSGDGGATWINKSGNSALSYVILYDLYINKEGYIYGCGDNPFSDGNAIFRSRDNGESWQRIGTTLKDGEVISALGVRQDGCMCVVAGGFIALTTAGRHSQ